MAGYFILSTRKGDYRALAFQGSQVYACHAQLSGLLRTHLGEAHARLLAEPLMDPQGTAVDWYTSGPVQPLAELPAETQEAVKTRLQGLLSDIEELAASLQTDSDPYKSLCGTMLHLATRFPTPECLYASLPSGEPASPPQPVLVCWGMTLSSSTAQEGIYAMGATPFSPEPQTPLASGASGDPDRIVREGEVTERPIVPAPAHGCGGRRAVVEKAPHAPARPAPRTVAVLGPALPLPVGPSPPPARRVREDARR